MFIHFCHTLCLFSTFHIFEYPTFQMTYMFKCSFLIFHKSSKVNNDLIILIILGIFNLLCWTKNEGVFYGIFLLISLIFAYSFSKKDKILILLGSTIILGLRFFLFNYYNTELNPEYFEMSKTFNLDLMLILYKLKTITFYLFV